MDGIKDKALIVKCALGGKPKIMAPEVCLIISCDASIKKNPGGPASVGICIIEEGRQPTVTSRLVNATTNNQAEYDAVYEALGQLLRVQSLTTNKAAVQIHSDSQLVVRQILGKWECKDSELARRRDAIIDKMKEIQEDYPNIPPVYIKWLPRNSTEGLKLANNAAQDELNVSNH